jgi:hypothetical protein
MTDASDKSQNQHKYSTVLTIGFFLVLLTGLILRFYQYLMKQNLWEDETHLALNFMQYGFLRLTQPLDHIQAAPIFFIFSVKTIISIFGDGEYAFRAVPFISTILTLPLFYYIVLELTKNKAISLIAFFVFSVNLTLIYFSAQLKPYACDVAAYLVLVYLAISQNGYLVKHRHLLLGLVGCVCILFSSVSFIVLICLACHMFMTWSREKRVNRDDVKVMIAWACVFIPNYFIFIHNHPSTIDQRTNYAFAFCPINVFSPEFANFMNKTVEETFFTMLLYISKEYYFPYLLLLIFVVAITHLIVKKNYKVLIFICLPILLHLILSAMKLYPFWFRLILYLMPCFIFLMAMGTYLIADFLRKKAHLVLGLAFTLYCCTFFARPSLEKFPMHLTNIWPALDFVNENFPTSESGHIYIMDPANAYMYYNLRGYVKNPIHQRVPWDIDPPEYYEFTSSEKSNYVLVYSQVYQWGYGDVIQDLKQKGLILKNFEGNGYIVSEIKVVRDTATSSIDLDYHYFDPGQVRSDSKEIAIYGGSLSTNPIKLQKGKYAVAVVSKGVPAGGVYPHIIFSVNEKVLGDYNTLRMFSSPSFTFDVAKDTAVSFKLTMDNDAIVGEEDRNTFIKVLHVKKIDK